MGNIAARREQRLAGEYRDIMNHTKIIQFFFALLFCIIAASSFALSYLNLTDAAIESGYPEILAWLWPLCIDAFIIMGSLFVLQANLNSESSWQGWVVLLSFTGASCFFNIVHSPEDLISRSAHALPPIALCASLELLMIRLKRDLKRETVEIIESTETPERGIDPSPGVVENIDDKRLKVLSFFTERPEASVEDARKDLKMGWGTVRDIRAELISCGLLSQSPSPE